METQLYPQSLSAPSRVHNQHSVRIGETQNERLEDVKDEFPKLFLSFKRKTQVTRGLNIKEK